MRLIQNEEFANVEWHSLASAVSGAIGANPQIIDAPTCEVVPVIPFVVHLP